jgi:site-specific DNA recombinase
MIHTHTKKGDKRYRYYTCTTAQKRGVAHCPTRSVNADELEGIVLAQVRRLAQAPELVQAMIAPVQAEMAAQRPVLQAEIRQARHALDQLTAPQPDGVPVEPEALEAATCRLNTLRAQLKALEATAITPEAINALLARFDPIWDALFPEERRRVLHLMLERVDYHGGTGTLGINFYPLGLQTLQDEVTASASETTQA